jgi:polyhydroxybutyrate depolymerase
MYIDYIFCKRCYMKTAWKTSIAHVFLIVTLTMITFAMPSASDSTRTTTASGKLYGQRLSQGCGRPIPKKPATSLKLDERRRRFILVVPKGYTSRQPHRLVFAFHGRTDNNAKVRGYYDLERHSAQPTLFVYPSGLKDKSGRFTWSAPRDPANALRDYAFFDTLLSYISEHYCLALDHVYVVGHSLGAWFSNSLACARASHIRAVGTVGGGISASDCHGPVAAMIVHNPKDRLVPFAGGQRARDTFLRQNGLWEAHDKPLHKYDLNCRRYGREDVRNPVLWCPHRHDYTWRGTYYPHHWPRETGEAIMTFFASLP